ncbi:MAG: DUF4924 family protein [Chlorobi bacterium]|nr:DUF4924 family protein [Chlorobiota bacterium]
MIIAKEKKNSNIAEYLIYMFQVEDLIRASEFDITILEKKIINQFKVTEEERKEIKNWYAGLINIMQEEKVTQKGHMQFLINTINDINDFHLKLLEASSDSKYIQLYQTAFPHIEEFKKRSKSITSNTIEICLNGLYSLFLLRLQKKEVSKESLASFSTFSDLLAFLSLQYKKYETGELEL